MISSRVPHIVKRNIGNRKPRRANVTCGIRFPDAQRNGNVFLVG
jgi:hypothetical protein